MSNFIEYAAGVLPEIEGALDRLLPPASTVPSRLHKAMRYAVFAGGKRVRPLLTLLVGETFGAAREVLLPGAAAMEMIHTFSLVHDDLPALDDDDLRRGRSTVHCAFDEATAVLVGDALLNEGLHTLSVAPPEVAEERRRRAVELVSEAVSTRGMIGGQMVDLQAERKKPSNPAAVLDWIHQHKTGALLVAAVRLGGVYAGVDAKTDDLLGRFGACLGLMFQVADDILDVEGTSEQLGKTPRKDIAAHKLTYPNLHGLDASREKLLLLEREAEQMLNHFPDNQQHFRSLVHYLSTRDH